MVLDAIYEGDFLGFSYGFRPGRSAHDALDALFVGIMGKKVNWVLDADIRGFFDTISHEWLVKFVEHRIADRRIVRLIQQWLTAGVSEDGRWSETTVGTPQGAVASPLLANVFLHYVFDLWVAAAGDGGSHGRRRSSCVMPTISYSASNTRTTRLAFLMRRLTKHLGKFGLSLHPEKTRLIGSAVSPHRPELAWRRKAGDLRRSGVHPQSAGKRRRGRFRLQRKTRRDRMRTKLEGT